MRQMTDLERCIHEGISLTELRKRREEVSRRMVEPAMVAFRKALAEHLVKDGRNLVKDGRNRVKRPKSLGDLAHF